MLFSCLVLGRMLAWQTISFFHHFTPWKFGLLLLQERRHPFLSVCAVLLCVQTVVWLPAFGIFNMCMDVVACNCTLGCADTVRESTLTLGEKSCRAGDSNPPQHWACGAQPTEPHHSCCSFKQMLRWLASWILVFGINWVECTTLLN